jgi:acyl-CoA thioesterase
MQTPQHIANTMLTNDAFSHWLGIQIINVDAGKCVLQLRVQPLMLNGFGIAHGGITYSLADTALAFAANAYGYKAVSIETSISHTAKCCVNDVLIASVTELSKTRKLAVYTIHITNQNNVLVAAFKGTALISDKQWE